MGKGQFTPLHDHATSQHQTGQGREHLPSSDIKVWNSLMLLFYIMTTTEKVFFYSFILKSIPFRIIPEKPLGQKNGRLCSPDEQ